MCLCTIGLHYFITGLQLKWPRALKSPSYMQISHNPADESSRSSPNPGLYRGRHPGYTGPRLGGEAITPCSEVPAEGAVKVRPKLGFNVSERKRRLAGF